MPDGKNVLTRKAGPLPVWGWVVGVVGAYLAYRWWSAGSTGGSAGGLIGASSQQPAQSFGSTGSGADLGSSGGGTSSGSFDSSGYQAYSDLVGSLETQNANLLDAFLTVSNGLGGGTTGGYGTTGNGDGSSSATSAASPHTQKLPAHNQALADKHGGGGFGRIISTRHLKSGATVTTYASGRKIEKAPGKKAYVIHK